MRALQELHHVEHEPGAENRPGRDRKLIMCATSGMHAGLGKFRGWGHRIGCTGVDERHCFMATLPSRCSSKRIDDAVSRHVA
jgi:hypothetical protein